MKAFWRAKSARFAAEPSDDVPPRFSPVPGMERVFKALRSEATEVGEEVDDLYFDRIYPDWYRTRSRLHWTPLPVIRRALELLSGGASKGGDRHAAQGLRILDVGSGAGKFCIAGSVLLPGARLTGIEQRPHFVQLSRDITHHYALQRITWVLGDLVDIDWSLFDGVYLFNPFQEHKTRYQRIDHSIPLSDATYAEHIRKTERKLLTLRPGSRVVTYHGFGGVIPPRFRKIADEYCFRGPLQCWLKEDPWTGSASLLRG